MLPRRRTSSAAEVLLLCVAGHAIAMPADSGAHIELVEPTQGFVSGEGALKVSWAVARLPADTSRLKVVLMVNGLTAQVTEPVSQGSMVLGQLVDGPYHVHVFLGEYDEFEGLSSVLSSALVECWVDTNNALGYPLASLSACHQQPRDRSIADCR